MARNFKELPLDALFGKLHGLIDNLISDIDSVIEDNKEVGMDTIKDLRDEITEKLENNGSAEEEERLLKILNLFSEDKAVIEIIREDAEEWLGILDAIEDGIKSSNVALTPEKVQELNAIKQLSTEVRYLARKGDASISVVPEQAERINALKRKRVAFNVAFVCFGFVTALLVYTILIYVGHGISVSPVVAVATVATVIACMVSVASSANSSIIIRKIEKGARKSEKMEGRGLLVLDLITNPKSFIDKDIEVNATVWGVLGMQPEGPFRGRVNIYIEDGYSPWWYKHRVLASLDTGKFSSSTIELFKRLRRGDGITIKGSFKKNAKSEKPPYYIDAEQVSLIV